MEKGLYDRVIDKDLARIIKEQDVEVITLNDSEVDSACKQIFEEKLKYMSIEDKKLFLMQETEQESIEKLVSIDDYKYEFIYPYTKFDEVSLFTGSVDEPSLISEFKKELSTSDEFLMLVSFIKNGGIAPLIDDLEKFTNRGGKLRVITTTYTKASDYEAILKLAKLANTEIQISYDVNRTRLHAKSYMFIRNTKLNSAYIGSSNFSSPALNRGLEWNVKLTSKSNEKALFKFVDKFDQYWHDHEFEIFDYTLKECCDKLKMQLDANYLELVNFNLEPYLYQEHILKQLEAQRKMGITKNLLVAATGTGKTVISAFDFRSYYRKDKNIKLLFVAHRTEILKQSLETFRHILGDQNFGDLLDGNNKPNNYDNLFVSIQSINNVPNLASYGFIIIDEVHHSGANSYQRLFDLEPQILLGLTATPFRGDGKDIREYFNNKVSAELGLIDALNSKFLCPFNYFGISDSVDLSRVTFTKGKYNELQLEQSLLDNSRINVIVNAIEKYTIVEEVKALGFCCSIKHAEFMSKQFNERGLKAIAITSHTSKEERNSIEAQLASGIFQYIFTVDIYNEGIDIPFINTVLFLRPTNSATIFLQQLGRGLRLHKEKEVLTILDFIGINNSEFKFSNIFRNILINKNVEKQFEENTFVPPMGCEISIEPKARERILDNLKISYTTVTFKKLLNEYGKIDNYEQFILDNNIILEQFYRYISLTEYFEKTRLVVTGVTYKTAFRQILKCSDSEILLLLKNMLSKKVEYKSLESTDIRKCFMALSLIFTQHRNFTFEEEQLSTYVEVIKYYDEFINLIDFLLKYRTFEEGEYISEAIPLKKNCRYSPRQIHSAYGNYSEHGAEGIVKKSAYSHVLLFTTLIKDEKLYKEEHLYRDEVLGDKFKWFTDGKKQTEMDIDSNIFTPILLLRERKKDEYGIINFCEIIGQCSVVEKTKEKDQLTNYIFDINGLIPINYKS